MKLTVEIAQVLVDLRGDARFAKFLNWVREYERREAINCVNAVEDIAVRQAQGAAKALARVVAAYDEAPVLLEKFRRNMGEDA